MLAIFHCIYIYLTIKSAMDVNENCRKSPGDIILIIVIFIFNFIQPTNFPCSLISSMCYLTHSTAFIYPMPMYFIYIFIERSLNAFLSGRVTSPDLVQWVLLIS